MNLENFWNNMGKKLLEISHLTEHKAWREQPVEYRLLEETIKAKKGILACEVVDGKDVNC